MERKLDHSLKTIVVPCAGRSKRFMSGKSKLYAPVAGKPLLQRVVEPWVQPGRRWIFISGPADENIAPLINTFGLDAEIVPQPEPEGITDAVLRAAPHAGPFFTVLLGDCIVSGCFDFDVPHECGVGVWRRGGPEDIRNNYGVETGGGRVLRAVEKPDDPRGFLCGMGIYFFDPALTDFCRDVSSEKGRGAHITSVLHLWVERGGNLAAVWFDGEYVNVNTVADLPRAAAAAENRNA